MVHAKIRIAILSIGAVSSSGLQIEEAVEVIRQLLPDPQFFEVDHQVVADEQALVRAKLRVWADTDAADVVLTCGGVDLGPRERTSDATVEVIERHLPGIPELIRLSTIRSDPRVALLRLEAGVRRRTLIINLPAESAWIQQSLPRIAALLPDAVRRLRSGDVMQTHF